MNRAPLLAALLLVSGCVRTLSADEWVTALPHGACRVDIDLPNEERVKRLERHHAADGRVLSGTALSLLQSDGRAWERFGYDDRARLAEIRSYEEINAEDFPCAVEGGCYSPARRVLTQTTLLSDDAGRLVRWASEAVTYQRGYGGQFTSIRTERTDRRYTYDDTGRLVAIDKDGTRYQVLYDVQGRLVRLTNRGCGYSVNKSATYDARGRIVLTEVESCVRSSGCRVTDRTQYTYDDAGRVVRADHTDPTGGSHSSYRLFAYQGDHMTRVTYANFYPGAEERTVYDYTFDERGHLTSRAQDGLVFERYRYTGACDAIETDVRAPSPLADIDAVVCHSSPAFLMVDHCFTAPNATRDRRR